MIPKFRLFDKNTKEWQSIRSIGLEEDGSILYVQCWDKHEVDIDPPYFMDNLGIDFELMQSTDLHDKNGKEIFEGDIVSADDGTVGKIEYNNGIWYVMHENPINNHFLSIAVQHSIKVLGNIHENPELLENI